MNAQETLTFLFPKCIKPGLASLKKCLYFVREAINMLKYSVLVQYVLRYYLSPQLSITIKIQLSRQSYVYITALTCASRHLWL